MFAVRICVASLFLSFNAAFVLAATAQQTVGESIEARKRASFAQRQQADLEAVATCFALQEAYDQFEQNVKREVSDSGFSANTEFWRDYLTRAGATAGQMLNLSNRATRMATSMNHADRELMLGMAPQLKQRLQQCQQAETLLQVNRCAVADVDKTPPDLLIPMVAVPMVRICREMAARKSRDEPASWVLESPDALAEFNTRIQSQRQRTAWYDELLSRQPIPQCPTDYEGGVCLVGCSGGSQAFGEAYHQVREAFEQFRSSTRDGLGDFDEMVARNNQNRVKWSLECEDFEMIANYTADDE